MYFAVKTIVSALVIAAVSELGRKSTLFASVLVSLPLTSILAMIWLYRDTGDVQKAVELSRGIFLVVVPSLLFFVVFPLLVKQGLRFYLALALSCLILAVGYPLYVLLLGKAGVKI